MPAPTTRTSTSAAEGSIGCAASGEELYRPVSLTARQGTPKGGAPHGGRGSAEVVGAPRALCDGAPGPGPEAALLRLGLLRDGGRAAVAAGLADGVPARGDPGTA